MKTLKISKEIEIILAAIAIAQGLYLSIISFLAKRRNPSAILLIVVFLSVTLRIAKSLTWMYTDDISLIFINIGFFAHSVFGPALLLFFYLEAYRNHWKKAYPLHFLPSLVLLILLPHLTLDNFWYLGGYSILLYHQMVYGLATLVLTLLFFIKTAKAKHIEKERSIWYLLVICGGMVLQFSYFSNYILGLTPYSLGPLVYALFLFITSIFIFMYPKVLATPTTRGALVAWQNGNTQNLKKRLLAYLMEAKPYLDPNCSLKSLADEIDIQPYKLSFLINKEFAKNFSSFINEYRITTAKKMLTDSRYANIKIAAIARDCGFHSLSSFNYAFKKYTGLTPSAYQKDMLKDL